MDGKLRQHFVGVGAKRLSATEAAKAGVSNGHELSASGPVLDMLGRRRSEYPCTYLYFAEEFGDGGYIEDSSTLTLYDAREYDPNRSPEWRLYYPAGCLPMESMEPGDYCWVAKRTSGEVVVVVAAVSSPISRRLDRLFGTDMRLGADVIPSRARQFGMFDLEQAGDDDIDLADADVLLALGLTPQIETVDRLPEMIAAFGGRYPFPTTAAFTAFARTVCSIEDPGDDPDSTLFEWVSTTNDLYFAYERHALQPILDEALANQQHVDIDRFFSLATRFKNARFSRAGSSFESHIAALLHSAGLGFSQPRRLPDGSKPDFLLPSLAAYGDADVPNELLTFLAAKTTTKERWRQVATEATLIKTKHLITMDRELNGDVLDAMDENLVVPVVPHPIAVAYPAALQERLMSVADFITVARNRQSHLITHGSGGAL